jgi:hypothetical protein
MLVQVEDSKFVRDTNSRALINQDYAAREEYYSKVKMLTANKNEINKLNDDVLGLKSEITEIKELLKQLLTK